MRNSFSFFLSYCVVVDLLKSTTRCLRNKICLFSDVFFKTSCKAVIHLLEPTSLLHLRLLRKVSRSTYTYGRRYNFPKGFFVKTNITRFNGESFPSKERKFVYILLEFVDLYHFDINLNMNLDLNRCIF